MTVGVAYDSDAIAAVLERIVRSARWTVVWRVASPESAVRQCVVQRPDLLLLQAVPGAADAARQIIASTPCGILLVVSQARRDPGIVFDAISAGALDVATAPAVGDEGQLVGVTELLEKMRMAATVSGAVPGREGDVKREGHEKPASKPVALQDAPPLVAVGASTGGPAALVSALARVPRSSQAAFVVVQHVAAEFCGDLAQWLRGQLRISVEVAAPGARLRGGVVTLAGGSEDLAITPALETSYRRPAPDSYYHPSVDVLFESLAEHWPSPGLAILMTGIGRDGAEGLLALRRSGWTTIAQDRDSSVVYGMPKAAREIDAASQVLPLDDIARLVEQFASAAPPPRRAPRE